MTGPLVDACGHPKPYIGNPRIRSKFTQLKYDQFCLADLPDVRDFKFDVYGKPQTAKFKYFKVISRRFQQPSC